MYPCGRRAVNDAQYMTNNIGSLEGAFQYNHHATPGVSWGCMVIVLKGSF